MQEHISMPYSDRQDIVYIEEAIDISYQLKQKPDAELYRRFPWLQFKNSENKKRYVYLGRQTQQAHTFYIKFSLSEQSLEGNPELNIRVSDSLEKVVEGILAPQIFQNDKKFAKDVQKMYNIAEKDLTLFASNNFGVHYGYLLTGIAKPSCTINEAYDSLFISLPSSQEQLTKIDDDNDSNSGMSPHEPHRKGVYNMMKLQWEYKYHSYEYFKFMSKAYQIISKKLKGRLQQDEVEEATSKELFNFSRSRVIRYHDSHHNEITMSEAQYFSFFSSLFKRNHEKIIQQMNKQPNKGKITLIIDEKEHELVQFDYKNYLKRKFGGIQLSQESLNRMIEHNRQRNKDIVNNFPFKTRRQRIDQLKKLKNSNKQIYNRIQLLPMIDQLQQSNIQEDHHFLIVFMREEEISLENSCSLRQVIDRRIIKAQGNPILLTPLLDALKIHKQKLFYDIHRQQTKKQYPLMSCFSCNPSSITLQNGILVPNFEHALARLLQFDQLPLTQEQQLLNCTPRSEINIYQELQKIVREYEQCIKQKSLIEFCSCLTSDQNDGLIFKEFNETQEVNLREQYEQNGINLIQKESLQLKMKLLQISMIDYQTTNNKRCLHFIPLNNNHNEQAKQTSDLPYNSFTPSHYKQLKQYLAILLINTKIITSINYPLITLAQNDNHKAIDAIKRYYEDNCTKYKKYEEENITLTRKYFRQIDQNTFRQTIKYLFQNFEGALNGYNHKAIKDMLRVTLKAHIVLQFLESRLIIQSQMKQKQSEVLGSEQEVIDNLQIFRGCVEAIAKDDKHENKPDLQQQRWKNLNQKYYKDLKQGIMFIQKQFNICRDIFRYPSLRSQEVNKALRSDKAQKLQQKIRLIRDHSLLTFCSIHSDLMKMDDKDLDHMPLLYKILLCFCCHLQQFHKNQVLQHQINQIALTNEKLIPKIFTFKNVLLTELVRYIIKNRGKYFHNNE